MVTKITFFEGHFDGAQFGPASIPAGETSDASESGDTGEEETAGAPKSRLVTFLQGATVFVVLFVTLWVVLSRLLADEDSTA